MGGGEKSRDCQRVAAEPPMSSWDAASSGCPITLNALWHFHIEYHLARFSVYDHEHAKCKKQGRRSAVDISDSYPY